MPIVPSISVSQSALTPSNVTVSDTSTGSDAAIAVRHIYFQTATGTYLVESGVSTDYNVWPYADASDTFDVLTEDTAVSIVVLWLNSSGTTLYTYTQEYPFSKYSKNFFYYLFQNQALSPSIVQDTNYYMNLATFWVNIHGAIVAVEEAADISASQNCFNRTTDMANNETKFF